MARAAVFVDMAGIDQNFDPRERRFILKTLQADLKVNQAQAEMLIQKASALLQLRGSGTFTKALRERLPEKERIKIMSELKELVKADSVVDGFEMYLLQRIAGALDVPLDPIPESD